MRVIAVCGQTVTSVERLPLALPESGYLWLSCARTDFQNHLPEIQDTLARWTEQRLVDLHVSDLLNAQLPSCFDYSAHYDLMVFRRLARSQEAPALETQSRSKRPGPPVLQRIDTRAVGFAVFDRVLLSVHPDDCTVRDVYAARLLASVDVPSAEPDTRSIGARGIPANPADMMLRIVSQMVDGYLGLRRELNQQLDHWQAELLDPRARFSRWDALLRTRAALHHLESLCEDQRSALQNWTQSLQAWSANPLFSEQDLELLRIRSRDVLEHIERVVQHVRRLEHNTETAVQIHFSLQGNRANDIMRMLTALTAIFLPLNLIAGIFGMNFEFMPWLHQASAFWWTLGSMVFIALALVLVFWRKRYLARTSG